MRAKDTLKLPVLGALLLLAACSPRPEVETRDVSAPIGATSRFEAQAFSGDWQVVARFAAFSPTILRVERPSQPGHLRLESAGLPGIEGLYRLGVPGELIAVTAGREKVIVLWVDEAFETAAIGTPSGSFGALLDRDGIVPADRAQAARDIFQFYGWDVSAMKGPKE